MASDIYKISSVQVTDDANNKTTYTSSELNDLGFIWNRKVTAKLSRLGNLQKEPAVMSSTIAAINPRLLIPDRTSLFSGIG